MLYSIRFHLPGDDKNAPYGRIWCIGHDKARRIAARLCGLGCWNVKTQKET